MNDRWTIPLALVVVSLCAGLAAGNPGIRILSSGLWGLDMLYQWSAGYDSGYDFLERYTAPLGTHSLWCPEYPMLGAEVTGTEFSLHAASHLDWEVDCESKAEACVLTEFEVVAPCIPAYLQEVEVWNGGTAELGQVSTTETWTPGTRDLVGGEVYILYLYAKAWNGERRGVEVDIGWVQLPTLAYDPSAGKLTLRTGDLKLNGYVITSPVRGTGTAAAGDFTGTAVLDTTPTATHQWRFIDNTDTMIAAQLPDYDGGGVALMGTWDFGDESAGHGCDYRDWTFEYTVEGVSGVFAGEIRGYLPGDADMDCDIDAWDIQQILAANSYGNGTGWAWADGDFDGDGDVDDDDIQLVLDTHVYGTGSYGDCGSASGMALAMAEAFGVPVPEPTVLAFLAMAAAVALRRRRTHTTEGDKR